MEEGATATARIIELAGDTETTREARRFVSRFLRDRGHHDLVDPAVLCVSELATNAVLHTRRTYEVTVRMAGDAVRVDVMDSRPNELPAPMPASGTASDVLATSTTGRGLRIVASLATRWGYSTSANAKFVWAEVGPDAPPLPTAPVVVLGHAHVASSTATPIRLQNLPVRAAVASGVQVDELVRELQLGFAGSTDEADITHLHDLLDRTAAVRFDGRAAALRSAAAGKVRFDLELAADWGAIEAIGRLSALLSQLPERAGLSAAPTDDVVAFRSWTIQEVMAQREGTAPTPCPLPD